MELTFRQERVVRIIDFTRVCCILAEDGCRSFYAITYSKLMVGYDALDLDTNDHLYGLHTQQPSANFYKVSHPAP
jgi:hypothetical protein